MRAETLTRAPRTVVAALLVVLVVAVLLAVRAFTPASPKLDFGPDWDFEAWSGTAVGEPITYGGLDPCVRRSAVTVIGIAFTRASNLVMTGWGSRPNPFEHGGRQIAGVRSTSAKVGFQTGRRTLHDACQATTLTGNPANNDYEFAIEFHRTGPATGWDDGLTITYSWGGGTHTAHVTTAGYVMYGRMDPLCKS